jgi:hypothetical protein
MDLSLWIAVALGIATLLGYVGRVLRRVYKTIMFIKGLTEIVHSRSQELETIAKWRQSVDSALADHARRLSAIEKRRR